MREAAAPRTLLASTSLSGLGLRPEQTQSPPEAEHLECLATLSKASDGVRSLADCAPEGYMSVVAEEDEEALAAALEVDADGFALRLRDGGMAELGI